MYNLTDGPPNALKWTPERVKGILNNILLDTTEQDVSYLNMALVRQGLYKDIWAYWKKVFARDPDILELMMRIDSIFEAKLYHAALHKQVSPWVAIFGLKYNHQWNNPSVKHEEREPDAESPAAPRQEMKSNMIIKLGDDKILIAGGDPGQANIYQKVKSERAAPTSGEETGAQKPTQS